MYDFVYGILLSLRATEAGDFSPIAIILILPLQNYCTNGKLFYFIAGNSKAADKVKKQLKIKCSSYRTMGY